MMAATKLGIIYCLVLFLIIGILGFLIYGYSLHDTILDSMKVDIQVYKDYNTFVLYVLVIMNLAVLCLSTMSIPLMFFSLKINTVNMAVFLKKRYAKYLEKANFNLAEAMKEESQRDVKDKKVIDDKTKTYIAVALYCAVIAVTILVTYLQTVEV